MFADFNNNQNSDDFLDEFRQKLNLEPSESFEERKLEISRSKNVFVGTISGIALAAVVGWFVLAPRYSSNTDVKLPVVRRPQTAIKVQPSEPGGIEIRNQDKSVYDIIEKEDYSKAKVENLLPPPEEPQLPVISATTDVETAIVEKAQEIITTEEAKSQINETKEIVEVKEVKTAPIPQPTPEEKKTQEETTETKEKVVSTVAEMTAKEVQPEIVEAKKETKPAPKAVAVGSWQVQLISSPNRQAVDTAWTGLIKKYPMLEGQPREIEIADLGTKGTYYRLKAGAFVNRSGADRLCNDIKASGGTCIVKKK